MLSALPLFLFTSCKIGNFSDIGGFNDYGPLFVYAGGSTDILAFKLDPENGSLVKILQRSLAGNVGSIIIDKTNQRLFAASGDSIYGFNINGDGSLSDLPGYPVLPLPGISINEIIFTDINNYIFALYDTSNNFYGYSYSQASGTLTVLGGYPVTLPSTVTTAKSINYSAFMFYSIPTGSWYRTDINPDGTYNSSTILGGLESNPTAVTAYDRICIFRDSISPPPYIGIYVYNFGIDSGEINTVRNFVNIIPGGNRFVSFNKPEEMLYFAHNAEPNIFCLKIYSDGNVDGIIKNFPTASITDFQAMEADPFGEFLVFSSGTAPSSYINIMKINRDGYPDSGLYNSQSAPQTINELKCFRFEK